MSTIFRKPASTSKFKDLNLHHLPLGFSSCTFDDVVVPVVRSMAVYSVIVPVSLNNMHMREAHMTVQLASTISLQT